MTTLLQLGVRQDKRTVCQSLLQFAIVHVLILLHLFLIVLIFFHVGRLKSVFRFAFPA